MIGKEETVSGERDAVNEVAKPEGNTQEGQLSVRPSMESTLFAYRLVLFAILTILVAFVSVIVAFAAYGILGEGNAWYLVGALIALAVMVVSLVVFYLILARGTTSTGEIEIPDQSLRTATEKLAKDNTSNHGQDYVVDYFQWLANRIQNRATLIASQQGRDVETKDLAQACAEIAPGDPIQKEQTLGERITSSITGITIISAILAVIFGGIGFAGLRWGGSQGAETVKAFIDIAQIFAGAVVGSTGAAAVSGR
jgi:hypothetical protein